MAADSEANLDYSATYFYWISAEALSTDSVSIISSVSFDFCSKIGYIAVNSIYISPTALLALLSLSSPTERRYTYRVRFSLFSNKIDLNIFNNSKKEVGVT